MNTIYDQLIIGAGFSGLCAAIQLKKNGENNFLILERNDHLGGTWYSNHYPGAACDVESHLYSFSFEPNPNWSRQFSPQQEILKYMEHCAEKYELQNHFRFGANITNAIFDEANGKWNVETENGEKFTSKIIVSCSGGLSQPSFPDIKGLETFKGKMFHTAQWENDFDLSNKTVAVIGTGASAIQIVPAIVSNVKRLNLYQRTPPWILPKPDGEISSVRKWLYTNFPAVQRLHRNRLYWQHEIMALAFIKKPGLLKLFSNLSLRFLKQNIADETLRAKLTPNYVMGCKRVLISNDYFPALAQKNVEVITEKINCINETGVLTNDGKQLPADVIILATGFKAAEEVSRFAVKGRNGIDLNDAWRDGAEAYLGTSVAGFPNMFLVVGPNTGLGHSSMILMIEAQVNFILEAVKELKQSGAKFVDIKQETQQQFNKDIQEKLATTVWQSGGCTSWYQTKSGKNVTLWPGFTFDFMKRTATFEKEKYEMV